MALSFRWTIADVSAGNFIPVTTGSYSLRVSTFASSTYAGTHVANGSWNFGTVADGIYQLWNEAGTPAQVVSFGEVYIVDNAPAFTTLAVSGTSAFTGVATFTSAPKSSAAATQTTELIRWDEAVRLADTQVITGQKSFNSAGSIVPYITAPTTTGLPTATGHFTSKYYVDSAVSAVTTSAFQESARKVRVFPDGTEVTDQVYLTVLAGVSSFATPTTTNLCVVEIAGMAAAAYISGAVGSLKDYVTLKGSGKHIQLYLLDITKTAVARLEDLTVLMGQGAGNGERSYNSMIFENCIIYHYHNLTLTNCNVRNCLFLGSSSYAVTVAGTSNVEHCSFNNAPTKTSTGAWIGVEDSFTWAPPSDPTTGT